MLVARIFLFTLFYLLSDVAHSQTKCWMSSEYKNEVKIWAASTIDSLKKEGIDTIIFYGVGMPENGRLSYGKIIWTNRGIAKTLEIKSKYINKVIRLTDSKYDSIANFAPIQFYFDYRLDTVTTNPRELFWMSHAYLHLVYSEVNGTEVCFIIEDYLLSDFEHLRSRWISSLCQRIRPDELCR